MIVSESLKDVASSVDKVRGISNIQGGGICSLPSVCLASCYGPVEDVAVFVERHGMAPDVLVDDLGNRVRVIAGPRSPTGVEGRLLDCDAVVFVTVDRFEIRCEFLGWASSNFLSGLPSNGIPDDDGVRVDSFFEFGSLSDLVRMPSTFEFVEACTHIDYMWVWLYDREMWSCFHCERSFPDGRAAANIRRYDVANFEEPHWLSA
jgi:hypothetical protein